MATADELLTAELCDNILTVDLNSRTISIPDTVTNIGVESDDNVEVMHFRLPRYHCEVDLSTFAIRINYLNAKGGGDLYEVSDPVIGDDLITFDWIVGRNAVTYKGNVTFNVCLKELGEDGEVQREFNTTIATLPVLPGLETGEMVAQEYADVLEQWRAELFGAGDEVMANLETAVDEFIAEHTDELKGPAGKNGYTFTPFVDSEGNLSWTNDGELENPETVNISGPPGETGAAFTYDMFTEEQLEALIGPPGETGVTFTPSVDSEGNLSWTNNGELENPETVNISGPIGKNGYTFTPSVDSEGNLSWTNDGELENPETVNIVGPPGETGAAFTYDMFTEEQLEALTGPPGETGAAFTYDMFTEEQLEALVGPPGETGAYIVSIVRSSGTGAAGTTDTYTITMSDGKEHEFQVYNGADGVGAGDMLKSVYDPQNKNTDIFAYVDDRIGDINTILDSINGEEI